MRRGKFIVIDGIDGSGKGLQARLLQKALRGKRVLFTHDPPCEGAGKAIADVIRDKSAAHTPLSDFFLFWAARAAHTEGVIAPALKKGTHVISDRFDSSTFAYQLCGENQKHLLPLFRAARRDALKDATPDAYIILDIAPRLALERRSSAKDKARELDRFEKTSHAHRARVAAGFRAFKAEDSKTYRVDASGSPEDVHRAILTLVTSIIRA
ncbi:dTMP kinase [Candidatus Kaiserbacteria bacterium CG10_big_fil_rev_8_21_14_0_10_59_10]|uniref:Thymidylate kinase n=1 Tax=Candidatus Kaiserbacteria bacterium CG10_big_fil_rev_8_21_14_0_10_59_10 TaxID=1974612 RepID=A0A2H0U8G8_9BACT|nr:MAG: dTMP kinase [Candidatus Kaiserbacteria bacterium CG10_big_fil_rev_8_21_14_0_10_59_10]